MALGRTKASKVRKVRKVRKGEREEGRRGEREEGRRGGGEEGRKGGWEEERKKERPACLLACLLACWEFVVGSKLPRVGTLWKRGRGRRRGQAGQGSSERATEISFWKINGGGRHKARRQVARRQADTEIFGVNNDDGK
jgi:hypothetical protein